MSKQVKRIVPVELLLADGVVCVAAIDVCPIGLCMKRRKDDEVIVVCPHYIPPHLLPMGEHVLCGIGGEA